MLKIFQEFPIRIHYSWYVAFGLISWALSARYFPSIIPSLGRCEYWVNGVTTTLMIFFCVLLHELGHAVVAKRFGIETRRINLMLFGGIAQFKGEPRTPKTDIYVSLAGPAVSCALGLGFLLFQTPVSTYLFHTNLWIAGLNLVPVFPLDGGRILRAALWARSKSFVYGTEKASKFGMMLSTGGIAAGIILIVSNHVGTGVWFLLLSTFIRLSGGAFLNELEGVNALTVQAKDAMIGIGRVVLVPKNATVGQFMRKYFAIYGYHGYPVEDNGVIIGMISYWNVRLKLSEGTVTEASPITGLILQFPPVVSSDTPTISSRASLMRVMEKMMLYDFDRLMVVHGERFIGMITRKTISRVNNPFKKKSLQ